MLFVLDSYFAHPNERCIQKEFMVFQLLYRSLRILGW